MSREAMAAPQPAHTEPTRLPVELLLRIRRALTTLGISSGESGLEGFGAEVESHLYTLCRGIERTFAAQLAAPPLQPAQPEQEPVAWRETTPNFYISELARNSIRFNYGVHGTHEFSREKRGECTVPVWFIAPQQRQPLTLNEIAKALASAGLKPEDYRADGQIEPLVRALEAAIGAKP